MSSGGMDWAYRMMAQHNLDPLGALVVMHLGWRDAASQRTDRGIAAALSQHRSAIQKATAKLAAAGIIARRSGQWVACETIAIVEQRPDAPRPSASADDGAAHSVGRPTQWAGGGPLSGPQVAHSVGPKRKEKDEKGARAGMARSAAVSSASRSAPSTAATGRKDGAARPVLTAFQRSRVLADQVVQVGGAVLLPGSPDMLAVRQALRSQEAEKIGGAL